MGVDLCVQDVCERKAKHMARASERKSFKSDRKSYRDFKPFSTRCEFESFFFFLLFSLTVFSWSYSCCCLLIFALFRGDDRKWTTGISISLWVMVMRGGEFVSVSGVILLLLTFGGAVNFDNFLAKCFLIILITSAMNPCELNPILNFTIISSSAGGFAFLGHQLH